MKILLSNDDGINAGGIRVLAEHLSCEHELFIVAPDRERSASGHSLTLHKPLRAEPLPNYLKNVKAWQVNGTPSDCVKIGLLSLIPDKPDLVISGINRGANLGTDILYSGTVSAAMEGAFMAVTSIAVSITSFEENYYETAAIFITKLIKQIQNKFIPPYTVLNVNVPDMPIEEIKGIKITKLGVRKYNDFFEKIRLHGKSYYWFKGDIIKIDNPADSDIFAIESNYISITPLHYDLTLYSFIDEMKTWMV